MDASQAKSLRIQIRVLLWLFILGLVLAGVTAIPLVAEINWLARAVGADPLGAHPTWLQVWLATVQRGVTQSDASYPFLSYGTDWLAFGHFAIAVAFIGPLRDPIKNIWVVELGMIASAMVLPFAIVMGAERGIPFGWRLIDCSFGVFGFLALAICRTKIKALESVLAAV